MNYRIPLIFVFSCFTLFASAQTDSVEKKTVVNEDTITHKENKEEKKQSKKENKNKQLPQIGGINISEVKTTSPVDSITLLKEIISSLNKENKKFSKDIQELKDKVDELNKHPETLPEIPERKNIFQTLLYLFLLTIKIFLAAIFIIAILFVLRQKNIIKFNIPFLQLKKKQPTIAIVSSPLMKQATTPPQKVTPPVTPPAPLPVAAPIISNQPKSFSNISKHFQKANSKNKDWYVVAASSIGKSHLTTNKPCQDNHYCENWGNGWGFAISCDGAGSAANSHLGSEFVAKQISMNIFKEWLHNNGYIRKNILPDDGIWNVAGTEIFKQIYKELEIFSQTKQLELSSLACTIIVVIYSPNGLITAHIGDGRAGFCNEKGEWKSIITPHKGEEANQTIFITTNAWLTDTNLKASDVPVPECRVIREKPKAFTLMSDGCETHTFDCSKMDNVTNKWHDPNIPSSKFFVALTEQLKSMYEHKTPFNNAIDEWKKFLEEGTKGLKEEPDDKTFILGIFI